MRILALLLALATTPAHQQGLPQQPSDPNLALYQNLTLGLTFTYPKVWERSTNKTGTRLLIPIPNTSDRGVIEIFSVNFRDSVDQWQVAQASESKAMGRQVTRQWQEEILGVPLLLTQASYTDRGSDKTSMTGLVYSLGFHKMLFRVTASPAEFSKVDYEWRKCLQTLRTYDGELPKAEDPSVKIERKDVEPSGKMVDVIPHPTVPHTIGVERKKQPVLAPLAVTFTNGTTKLGLHLPDDWKAEARPDGSFVLSQASVDAPVDLTVFSVNGNDPSDIALFKVSGRDLNDFTSVSRRSESLPKDNRAGVPVGRIWREGKGAKGELFTCEASGLCGDFYFILTFRTTDHARWGTDQDRLDSLLDQISIEPVK